MGSETNAEVVIPKRKRLGLLGKKLGMTQLLLESGRTVAVTVLEAGPCTVVQNKTSERDGYSAVQMGYAPSKAKSETKATIGHAEKAGKGTFHVLREFQTVNSFDVGAELKAADMFSEGDLVHVTGTTKGRGFAGVIKRHSFGGFRATHGTHEYFRHGGAIGNRSYPGRVFKGKRMAGHMGSDRVTTRNLEVVQVRPDENLILVVGSVPGPRGGYIEIRPAGEDVEIQSAAPAEEAAS